MATIGHFLCYQSEQAGIEHVDEVRRGDKDARQEAALRSWVALTNKGLPIVGGDGTFASALDEADEEYHYPSIALRWAYSDARRRLHGRGSGVSRTLRTERLDGYTISEDVYMTESELSAVRSNSEWMADAQAQAEFDVIEMELPAEIERIMEQGEAHAQAVSLMLVLQQLKALGVPIPQSAHSALARLRKATGLALNVTLL